VAYWVGRAKGQRLDRVDWSDHSSAPHQTRRTAAPLEDQVLQGVTEEGCRSWVIGWDNVRLPVHSGA
jgi:hypothetical protein